MKLHILRHAKTEPIAASGNDFERKLLQKGIAQAEAMGTYLNEKLSRKLTVYASSSQRTTETTKLIQQNFAFRDVRYDPNLYLASLEYLLKFVWSHEENHDFMLIGHNDGLSELACYFTDEYIGLKTCGYCCIEFSTSSWLETASGLGRLVDAFRPEIE